MLATYRWYLRAGKLRRKPDGLRLTPRGDTANVPPFLPLGVYSPSLGPIYALAFTSLVLVSAEADAVRTDHNKRLLFGRAPAAAAAPGQPWHLWKPQARVEAEEDKYRGSDHTLLHRHRTGFQTVGQSYRLWPRNAPRVEAEEYSPQKSANLAAYRQPVLSTAGQPFFLLYARPGQLDQTEVYEVRPARPDLHRYRQAFQTVGQSYRLWSPPAKADQTIEPDAQRVDQTTLHRYRTAYQTVGQPFALWPGPQKRLDAEEYAIPKPVDLTAFRNSPPAAATAGQPFFIWPRVLPVVEAEDYRVPPPSAFVLTRVTTQTTVAGQPWYLWPAAKADQTIEADAPRADHNLLHRYRVGFQTVGQPWLHRVKPPQRVDAEPYDVPPPASLHQYRQFTQAVAPGQPWWMWPRAVADQTVEPNPVVTDHASALYPFRPHQAVTPAPTVIDDDDMVLVGGGPRRPDYRVRNMEAIITAIVAAIDAADG